LDPGDKKHPVTPKEFMRRIKEAKENEESGD